MFLFFLYLTTLSIQGVEVYENFRSDFSLLYDVNIYVEGRIVFNQKRNQYMFKGRNVVYGVDVDFGVYEVNKTSKEVVGGQCHDTSSLSIGGMFEWVKYANYTGHKTILGQNCSMYELPEESLNVTYVTCLNSDDIPVIYGIVDSDWNYVLQYSFQNQEVGDFPVSIPGICSLPLNTCKPEDPVIQTFEFVRFHDIGDYTLKNVNSGDLLGDTYFLCMTKVVTNQTSDFIGASSYSIISIFEVSVNTTWGQYANCNNGVCEGGMKGTVGREVALGVAPWGGQCAPNKEKGSWYSTQERDECKKDIPVKYPDCAWKMLSVKKSIEYSCVKSHGFEDACLYDAYHPPFTRSYKVLKQAFESDDFSEGGCKDIK